MVQEYVNWSVRHLSTIFVFEIDERQFLFGAFLAGMGANSLDS